MPEDASCSRAKSRVARALLRKRGILGAAMPATCPLHADLYGDQEQHKRALRRSLYKCAYCGKTFSSEDWLDRHFDRKHADTLAADGFCLGDLCDVLDCAAAPRRARTRPSYYDDDGLHIEDVRKWHKKEAEYAAKFAKGTAIDSAAESKICVPITSLPSLLAWHPAAFEFSEHLRPWAPPLVRF